jgi:hypothetical protein
VKLLKVKRGYLNILPSLHLGQRPLKIADDRVFFFNTLIEILIFQFNNDFILAIKNFIRGIVAQKVKLVRVKYTLSIQG